MSSKEGARIYEAAIFTAKAIVEGYFSANPSLVKKATKKTYHPVALTAKKKPSGWASDFLIRGLVNCAQTRLSKDITIEMAEHEDMPALHGFMDEDSESRVRIYVRNDLNFCWRRFVVAKELSHLLMNCYLGDSVREARLEETERLFDMLLEGAPPDENNLPFISEYAALIGAVEMLIPKRYVEGGLLENSDILSIAEQLKVPRKWVEMRSHPEFLAIIQPIYEKELYQMAPIHDHLYRSKNCRSG